MSDEWPHGWYRDEQGPSFTPRQDPGGSPNEPTQAVPLPADPFASTSAGSVVEWDNAAAKVFFHDLATDTPLPKNLVTGGSVAGTT